MLLPSSRALLRVAAFAALLVCALGLPRLLVLCEHTDGDASLAFAHAPGSCCHAAAAEAGAGGHDGPALEPDHGCKHTGFVIDMMPVPRPAAATAPVAPPACDLLTIAPPALPVLRTVPRPPPATGPPRIDRRTALRGTTLLLV
jgi:hypothetical protein